MAFLRRRNGGDGDGQQPPAEQPTEVQQPSEPTYEPPEAQAAPPEPQDAPPPAAEPPPAEQPTSEQPASETQAAVTSEPGPSERDRQAAAEQQHMEARPQTDEDIPDNIWDQTREGEEPYKWHSGTKRPHGSSDAIEFIDVKKSFGRNTILNGLNLGVPDDQISMILGPSGTGKSVCIKHMVGLLYPDEGDVLVHG